ncbi:hypothetical protein [Microbacterium sp.]|uniref:hypothetical protein n=1 Tax=Microbacterium sp. TaxID=51671 RepID=UPI003F730355
MSLDVVLSVIAITLAVVAIAMAIAAIVSSGARRPGRPTVSGHQSEDQVILDSTWSSLEDER